MLAAVSVLGAGTAAAALAGAHPVRSHVTAAGCQRLCVSVRADVPTVAAGQTASFGIHISPSSLLDQVTVRISVLSSGTAFPAPAFTSCGDGSGTRDCTVGLLQAGQATELGAEVRVPGSASGGERATLSATVTWTLLGLIGTGSATGSATIEVAGIRPTPAPTPHPTATPSGGGHPSPAPSGGSSPGAGRAGQPYPGLSGGGRPQPLDLRGTGLGSGAEGYAPPLGVMPPAGGTGADGSYAGLFPVIRPLPAPARSRHPQHTTVGHGRYRATEAADTMPLNVRQLGIQVAGLIALALGIAIAMVRIPLRRRRAR